MNVVGLQPEAVNVIGLAHNREWAGKPCLQTSSQDPSYILARSEWVNYSCGSLSRSLCQAMLDVRLNMGGTRAEQFSTTSVAPDLFRSSRFFLCRDTVRQYSWRHHSLKRVQVPDW